MKKLDLMLKKCEVIWVFTLSNLAQNEVNLMDFFLLEYKTGVKIPSHYENLKYSSYLHLLASS